MKRQIFRPAALSAVTLALALALTGCAPSAQLTSPSAAGRSPLDWPQQDSDTDWYQDWLDSWQGASPLTEEQRRYGSAGLLAWPTALVSVYLDEADGAVWDEESIARSRETLAIAVDWIESQCRNYNIQADIAFDDGTPDSGLFVHATYNGSFAGGTDSAESDDFYTAVYDLCDSLDTPELRQACGTSSIGFLIFLPVEGASFTMVHYLEDGDDAYHEFSCLYKADAYTGPDAFETPAVYAHEILHQYGAPDLYDSSSDYYVTPQLTAYVAQTWPDEIMLDTYGPEGSLIYGGVEKQISPLTAARLGLCSSFPGQEQFPQVLELPAGIFSTGSQTVSALPDLAVAARPAG